MIARNSVRDTEGDAIIVGCPPCPVVVGTVVRRNHIRGAGEDGVHIDDKARHTLLRRNRAIGAKDDGLDVKTRDEADPQRGERATAISASRPSGALSTAAATGPAGTGIRASA